MSNIIPHLLFFILKLPQYDYAFYVVDNSPNAHSGGYSSGLSGILEKDVQPANIDFNTNHKDFTVALGYSADKDPNFRYCSMDADNINGVPWYTNLWLDDCGMTGGASGGPWTRDMDESGVGTVISVNSWGFMDKKGMAGPGKTFLLFIEFFANVYFNSLGFPYTLLTKGSGRRTGALQSVCMIRRRMGRILGAKGGLLSIVRAC